MKQNIRLVQIQNGEKFMETSSLSYEKNVYNQIEEAFGKVVYTYTTHIIQAKRIQKINRRLKWVQIILSAVSAGGFLGTIVTDTTALAWIGGLCSTILLVLTSYFKDMDLTEKQNQHLDISNQLWLLREDYLSLLIDFPVLDITIVVEKRELLKERASKIYAEAPITDEKSYKLAQQALQKRESQYFTRNELNMILPQNLRK